jgi:hypothetical protein
MGACFDGFFFAIGRLIGLLPKNYEIPFPPKKVTLFYTYTILHDHIKSNKCIYLTLTLFYTVA